jgi:DNA-binding transcriptional LysR family regulator
MNFTFHQLKIFLEVARKQSVTKAAEEMYMTQPALSIQLRNFQNQFSVALYEKIGKRIYLTDFGESIAAVAENILKEAEALKYKTKEYEGLLTGKLRISSASTGKYVIPYLLTGFIQDHPGIDLKLDVSNKTKVMANIKDNEVDFALVSVVPKKIDVHEEVLLENRLYLVGNQPEFRDDLPLIYREEGSATRIAMESYMGNPLKRKSIELTSNEAVKQAAIAGLGYSILPLIGIKNEIQNKELFIIPSKGLPITTHWRLIWLKDKKLSPLAASFLEYIQKEKNAIRKKHFQWYINYVEKSEMMGDKPQ